MALSVSMNGMSSLRTSTDRNILDNNFGNEAYSPEYDAYMCTNIGKQYTNYDNYYMNGLYTSMNVAKDSYHIKGRGNNAIFAVCRGVGDNEEAFNASRKVFEYLDKSRDEILNRKTISSIKKALRKFAEDCHSIFFKDAISKKYKISLLIVVYNPAGTIFMNCGECTLLKIDKNNNCKIISDVSDCIGTKDSFKIAIKTVPKFLSSHLLMTTEKESNQKTNNKFALTGEKNSKGRTISMMEKLIKKNSQKNHTCITIDEDASKTIMPSTKVVAMISAVVTAISIINMLIQNFMNV